MTQKQPNIKPGTKMSRRVPTSWYSTMKTTDEMMTEAKIGLGMYDSDGIRKPSAHTTMTPGGIGKSIRM